MHMHLQEVGRPSHDPGSLLCGARLRWCAKRTVCIHMFTLFDKVSQVRDPREIVEVSMQLHGAIVSTCMTLLTQGVAQHVSVHLIVFLCAPFLCSLSGEGSRTRYWRI